MNYKTKLVFVALLPIILISFATIFVVNIQYNRLATSQSGIVEKMYLDLKKNELKNYIELAQGAVDPVYTSTLKTKRQAQRQASDILRKMSYGRDNYFFVYDEDGTNIVNPRLTYFVGNNWLGLENSDGKHIIRDMIKIGQDGGGFYEHTWLKPSTGEYVDKLAYSTFFPKWGWMLGTGIYLDDVTEKVNTVQTEMSNSIKQTRFVLLLLSVGAISVTTIILAGLQLSEQRLADAKLKSLTARIVEIQEDERKRVSRELHDSISQLLVSARYGIENALSNTRRGSKVIKPINTSMKALDAAINEVRRIEPPLVYRSQKSTETRRMTNGNSGNRFTPEIRARAVCLVLENEADYTSRTQAVLSIAKKIGCNGDTLRVWVRNHEIEIGLRNGVTQAERDELKILQRENKELRQANDILRKASAFFAAAELDRLRKK